MKGTPRTTALQLPYTTRTDITSGYLVPNTFFYPITTDAYWQRFVCAVLFTDEAAFTGDGILNFHNAHHLYEENPYNTLHQEINTSSVKNVFVGIDGDILIRSVFLHQRLTG